MTLSTNDNNNNSFWENYRQYLAKNFNHSTAKARLSYAKQYWPILNGELDATNSLLLLSNDKRIHIMKSLATLAKYTGRYDTWQAIRERHQLKWSNGQGSVSAFQDITSNQHDFNAMVSWLKNTYNHQKVPREYGNILIYNTLTGLRPQECIQSIKLLKSGAQNYYNKQRSILEHFNFPSIFFRRTKKAYISIVDDKILDIVKKAGDFSYVAIRLFLNHRSIPMNMGYCRKIYATCLRSQGIEAEIIDILQGRAPKTVFARHYFRPGFLDYKNKVLQCLNNLYNKLLA